MHTVNDVLDCLIYNQNSENENTMRKYIVNSVQEAFRYVEYSCNVQFGGNSLHAITAYFFCMNQHFRKQNISFPMIDAVYIRRVSEGNSYCKADS